MKGILFALVLSLSVLPLTHSAKAFREEPVEMLLCTPLGECRTASPKERARIDRKLFEIYGGGFTMIEYVARGASSCSIWTASVIRCTVAENKAENKDG